MEKEFRGRSVGQRALAYMAASSILFALMNFFARLASSSANWATVGAVRAFLGAAVAVAVARARGTSLAVKDKRSLLWRTVFGTIAMLSTFFVLSSHTVSLGDTVTLLNLTPVFLAALAPIILRERTNGATVIAIAIALTGVLLLARPSFLFHEAHAAVADGRGPSEATTIAVAVLAALSTAIAMMMLRRAGQTDSPEAVSLHYSSFAALTMTVLTAFDPKLPAPRDAIFIVLTGICGGFGQLTLTRAYTLERAARVSGMSYLSVVASALLGAAALGERPTAVALLGMALVIAGGLVVTFVPKWTAREPT